jgi:hypothetical protein
MLYDQYEFVLWTQHTCCVSVISFRLSEGQIGQLKHNISDSFFFLVCVLQFSSHVAHISHVHKPVLCCTVCQPFSFSSLENVFLVTCIRLMATFYALIFCQIQFEEQKFSTIQTSYGSETWDKRIVNWSQICQTHLKNGYRLSVIKVPIPTHTDFTQLHLHSHARVQSVSWNLNTTQIFTQLCFCSSLQFTYTLGLSHHVENKKWKQHKENRVWYLQQLFRGIHFPRFNLLQKT